MQSLVKINDVYYFRLRIPKDVRRYFLRPEIVKSTHAKKYNQAKGMVRGLLGKIEGLFMMIRSKTLDDAGITKIVRDFVESTLELKYDRSEELLYSDNHRALVNLFWKLTPPSGQNNPRIYSKELCRCIEVKQHFPEQDHTGMNSKPECRDWLNIGRKSGCTNTSIGSQEREVELSSE